jgi:type I restriction enzyme R subunit
MSRRICIELYREIVALRPHWHADEDGEGAIKVVMTGSASDPLDWQPHIRNKKRREAPGRSIPGGQESAADRARA